MMRTCLRFKIFNASGMTNGPGVSKRMKKTWMTLDYDEEKEAGGMDEQEHEEKRHEREKKERQRRRAMGNCPELSGIDAKSSMSIQQYLSHPF